ncbi:conserved hypothetical protein [Trichinella spiralis]|uniref:hypothetical protein n=1 Tax=Trichinella spiralis TaxID=6334 RepID=UPI0001EFE094|nr:conserved hypothetical protein [Trichinella spiralis]
MSAIDVNESLQSQGINSTSQGSNAAEENGEGQRQRLDPSFVIFETLRVDLQDESSVRRLILYFKNLAAKNQELRIKYPNDPIQFLDSDIELNMTIRDLHCLSNAPQFYGLLVRLNAVSILCQLLLHPKCSIGLAVADLLFEMIEIETEPQYLKILIDALMDAPAPECLLTNLKRFLFFIAVLENPIQNTTIAVDEAVLCINVQWLLIHLTWKNPFDYNEPF